ncbi:hypothetical protein SCUCBS95973_006154 [Sporothrix curviconia]|uniref:Alpha-galactosidase n=1 Tax=Sporothrix curviconia TaxID=1260050 RepID=A0ABP0C2T5_9PEZI
MSHEYSFVEEFEAFLPKKKPAVTRPRGPVSDMGPAVSIATHPPLGQVTTLASGRAVAFHAVVEHSEADTPFEVALWHSLTERAADIAGEDGAEWTATAFELVGDADDAMTTATGSVQSRFHSLQDDSTAGETKTVRHYYRAEVRNTSEQPLHFTVRFRQAGGEDVAWRWVGDEQQIGDGTVLVNRRAAEQKTTAGHIANLPPKATTEASTMTTATTTTTLEELIGGLNTAFSVKTPQTQCPGTQLWELETQVDAAKDDGKDESAYTTVAIGAPWHGRFLRWFSLVRLWAPWLAPRHGRQALDRELDGVLCSFLSQPDGRHLVFLALSGVDHVQGLFQGEQGQDSHSDRLVLHVRSDSLKRETATVLVAVGDTFESANAAVMYHARSLVHQMAAAHDEATASEIQTLADEVQPAWLENWYDGLGFCTWNALGQNLSEDKIVATVDELARQGIRIANLIIDDNWQSIDRAHPDGQFQYTWTRFEADPQQFPQGLKHAIQRIRTLHPTIEHVAVWHALLGYWGGLTPAAAGGALAQAYANVVVTRAHPKRRNLPIAGPMTVVAEPDVRRFYNDFYTFLVSCGVDGVKTDAQFITDTWTSAKTRRELTTAYQDAWTVATLRHFGSRAVSCMSQTPNILFYSQLPQNRPPMLVRNSDDFFPDVPASHPWHVWTNAHNSLFTQHLNVLPDWDMFQTVHGYSRFHAAARCVSGGPIYITDTPGQHDLGLIHQMTGTSVYDKTVIFRPSVVGRSLDQYVDFHDNVLLKVGSYHGSASGTGILGVFNVSDRRVLEMVPIARVPGVDSADSTNDDDNTLYVARAHTSGKTTGSTPVRADALLTLALDVYQYEIVSVYKVHSFKTSDKQQQQQEAALLHVANLGLVGKMASAATVVSTSYSQRDDNGRVAVHTSFKAPGLLGLYVSGLAEGRLTVKDSFLVTMRDQPIPAHCAAVSAQDPNVVEIDTARAWKELGFKPMMNNEVQLTVYISVE